MSAMTERALSSVRMQDILRTIAMRAVSEELGQTRSEPQLSPSDVNFALLSASALTAVNVEAAQDAVLRVAHAVLRDDATSEDQKAAAIVILDRVGNRRAINLALDRFNIEDVDYSELPVRLAADALVRRSQLTLDIGEGEDGLTVNPFQRQFWALVQRNNWVSVSAPTSAGKSFIVREWMKANLEVEDERRLVYLAPTRALVEEVGAHFRATLDGSYGVHTLPWDPDIPTFKRQVFVLTQERLHLLQERSPLFSPDVIFIDEAQKISEGTRGILLSQVLDESVMRNPQVKLVFASPMSENPGVLLLGAREGQTTAAIIGESVTVNQNLVFVSQKPRHPSTYQFNLVYQGLEHQVGEVTLRIPPSGVGERLPFIAAAVGGLSTGNLVYANGPSAAEKYARLIYESLGAEAETKSDAIQELIDFAQGTVHEKFVLAKYARRGIAFHYGDMPLVLKAKVEDLFRQGAIRYLVCTSTLLEGVNLPCRNIFMRGPMKGSKHMSMADFWNLAGRAGRWGTEFQGNIFCIDVRNDQTWPEKPGRRARSAILPAASDTLGRSPELVRYIEAGAHKASAAAAPELEATFSWLTGRYLQYQSLEQLAGVALDADASSDLHRAVMAAVDGIDVPVGLIKRHAGISPLSMQRMYDAVIEHGHPEELALVPPVSDDAKAVYEKALGFIAEHLGGSFFSQSRRRQLAGLIVNWMKGMPLSRIIENRATYRRQRNIDFNYPKLIRDTLEDVEDIARFEAPKYLSCYSDLVGAAAAALGAHLGEPVVDIEMMLELGVPRRTDMSLIAAGLSRATVRELASHILEPELSPAEALTWIRGADPESLDMAAFATRELTQVQAALAARLWG